MYTACNESTANLKLIDKLNVGSWRAALNDLITVSGNFWVEAATDCLRASSDGIISVKCRHTNF
jgi:hypothetical protein